MTWELDQARALLRTHFADTLPPAPLPAALTWADSLRALPAGLDDTILLRIAADHHLQVIDATVAYLREATNPAVRSPAEQIRARKVRELQRLQGNSVS